MTGRYAILVDGAFLNSKLKFRLGHDPDAEAIVKECERIMGHPSLASHSLLRIYYYHAPPYVGEVCNPISNTSINLDKSDVAKHNKSLLSALELKDNFALRLGETTFNGWKLGKNAAKDIIKTQRPFEANDFVPDITQKGVDLRIGLDIARLSLCKIVDIIVLVTGDSDFIPALKFARREGVRVYLDHMSHGVRRDLKVHTDLVF